MTSKQSLAQPQARQLMHDCTFEFTRKSRTHWHAPFGNESSTSTSQTEKRIKKRVTLQVYRDNTSIQNHPYSSTREKYPWRKPRDQTNTYYRNLIPWILSHKLITLPRWRRTQEDNNILRLIMHMFGSLKSPLNPTLNELKIQRQFLSMLFISIL